MCACGSKHINRSTITFIDTKVRERERERERENFRDTFVSKNKHNPQFLKSI